MKRKTTTEVVTKALARSGPEITPSQIRLDDSVQTDNDKVFTQSDLNQSIGSGGGGGGGGGAPIDLDGYATTEQLSAEADARDTGDKANLGLIESVSAKVNGNTTAIQKAATKEELQSEHNAWTLADEKIKEAYKKDDQILVERIRQVEEDLDAVENDYTTTDEFNLLNSKCSQNKKDIASLGEAFDTAVLAAQEGAENLEIELQSYAKKEDIPEAAETPTLDQVCKKGYTTTETIGVRGIATTDTFDARGKHTGVEYAHFYGTDSKSDLKIKDNEVTVGDTTRSEAATLNVHGTVNATEFVGDGSKLTNLPTGPDIDLDEYARLDGATFSGQVAVRNSNNWLFLDSKSIQMTAEGMLQGHTIISANSIYISNDDDSIAFSVEANSQLITAREFSVEAKEFIGDGSKLTNLPAAPAPAASLPGHKWKLVPYSAAEKPGPGEMMHDDSSQSYFFNATDADGVVLGNPMTAFDAYSVNGTMLVSMYKQGTGIEAIFKAAAVSLKTELDKTFFHIVETNHQRLNLQEGQTYSVTASGLF